MGGGISESDHFFLERSAPPDGQFKFLGLTIPKPYWTHGQVSFPFVYLSNNYVRFHKAFCFPFSHQLQQWHSWYGGEPSSVVWMIKAIPSRMAKPKERRSFRPRAYQAILQKLDFTCLRHCVLGLFDTTV